MKREDLARFVQNETYTLAQSLMKDIPRIKDSTITTVWMLGCNLTPKQIVDIHPDKPTLTTVYKINSRFKETIELLKQETHHAYKVVGLIIE
ncbi:hypothetical protein ACAS46_000903 [Vibrio vulnificus]